jgi:hypothetical protein
MMLKLLITIELKDAKIKELADKNAELILEMYPETEEDEPLQPEDMPEGFQEIILDPNDE